MFEVNTEDLRVKFSAPEIIDNNGSAVAMVVIARVEMA
jgi:hypothetical protein